MNNFAIVSVPRTGSNFLCQVLNQHPEVLCHAELFHAIDVYPAYGYDYDFMRGNINDILIERNSDPVAFLNKVFVSSVKAKPGINSIGFKIFNKQNGKLLNHILDNNFITKIILKRKNILQHYISLQVAVRTGKWITMKGESNTPKAPKKFIINPEKLLCFFCNNERYFQSIESRILDSGGKYIKLYYEDIINENDFFTDIQKFLNLKTNSQSFEIYTSKSQVFSYKEIILNYDELAEQLSQYLFDVISQNSIDDILKKYHEIKDWNEILQIQGFIGKIQSGEWDI